LSVTRGKFLTIVDEDGEWGTLSVNICPLPPNHPIDAASFILPDPLPKPTRRIKPAVVATPATPPRPVKEKFEEDENGVIEIDPTPRRPSRPTTVQNGPRVSRKREHSIVQHSPSKKRRLAEDGLVMLDGANDQMMDDVIVIDDD